MQMEEYREPSVSLGNFCLSRLLLPAIGARIRGAAVPKVLLLNSEHDRETTCTSPQGMEVMTGKDRRLPNGSGGQNRFGIPFWLEGEFTTHFSRDFSGDWDVHWGYGILTHAFASIFWEGPPFKVDQAKLDALFSHGHWASECFNGPQNCSR